GTVVKSGSMTESPAGSGHYTGTASEFYPNHGSALVVINISCPIPGDNQQITFNIYIDPSGVVLDTTGHAVTGATVTLYRSDSDSGPFNVVPDGSEIMSPANRANPTTTGTDGAFGWDVIAGFYRIRAAHDGC